MNEDTLEDTVGEEAGGEDISQVEMEFIMTGRIIYSDARHNK